MLNAEISSGSRNISMSSYRGQGYLLALLRICLVCCRKCSLKDCLHRGSRLVGETAQFIG